jgi:hypothetical protein
MNLKSDRNEFEFPEKEPSGWPLELWQGLISYMMIVIGHSDRLVVALLNFCR